MTNTMNNFNIATVGRCTTFLILLLLSVLFLPLQVFAHPGGTDSDGGHTDKSTGEYHYHHGYSAHQHRDMDGDGDLDCPYNFVDKTGQNSGTPSSNSKNNSSSNKYSNSTSVTEAQPKRTLWTALADFFSTGYGSFCIIAVMLQIVIYILILKLEEGSKAFNIVYCIGIALFLASFPVSMTIILIIVIVSTICGVIRSLFQSSSNS